MYTGTSLDFDVIQGKMGVREAWNKSYDVNVTGTHIMTHTFVPLLLKATEPRLLFVTSGTSSLEETMNPNAPFGLNDPPKAGWPKEGAVWFPSYRSSKTGMNMMVREWDRWLRNDNVKVFAISPGYLATGLGAGVEANKKRGAGDPQLGGEFIKDVVEGQRDADVGKAIRRDNKVQPW